MFLKSSLFTGFFCLAIIVSFAQKKPPPNWQLLDWQQDGFPGTSVEKAYNTILKNKKPKKKIIVAVIGDGLDSTHPDLAGIQWTNTKEIPGNNIDDDGNFQ